MQFRKNPSVSILSDRPFAYRVMIRHSITNKDLYNTNEKDRISTFDMLHVLMVLRINIHIMLKETDSGEK